MRRRLWAVVAAAILAFGLLAIVGGCARDDDHENHSASACTAPLFAAPYFAVDPCSAEAVLISAARAIFTYRPDHQRDPADAVHASAPLNAPDYLRRIGASAPALAPVTAVTWARWSALGICVTVSARITADDHSADLSNHASRVIAVTQHPGDEPSRALTAYMRAARTSAHNPWLVTDVEIK